MLLTLVLWSESRPRGDRSSTVQTTGPEDDMAKGKRREDAMGVDEWQDESRSRGDRGKRGHTSVAKITEISATSTTSFEDAIRVGIGRANKTLRNVRSAWIKEQQVRISGGSISEYQVNMLITFVIDD
jgi:flavin-binding protein dodecin